MKRPLSNVRPFAPLFKTNSESDGLTVYHYTKEENLDSILENGIKSDKTSGQTKELEKILEKYRPDSKPSRLNAVFTHVDKGIATSMINTNGGGVVLSFGASQAPCNGYGVISTGELMGLASLVTEDDVPVSAINISDGAENFWKKDVGGPINTEKQLNKVQDRIEGFGEIEEIYFPCDIPPGIIKVVNNASPNL
jgi:hypothetical protein